MKTARQRAMEWIVGRDTGLSSEALWAHMMGVTRPEYGWSYPHDPADIGRCFRLLKFIPAWERRLHEMARLDPVWRALVRHWRELREMMDEEVGIDWSKGERAPLTYKRMREIIDPVENRARSAA